MKKTYASILLVVLTVTLLLQTVGLAWVSDNGLSSLVNITGNVHKNYFEYGKGTADDPYGIASPVQLYYFAWLQYLGFFNPDLNNDNVIDTTYYFELANDIQMKDGDIQYTLPPIGTIDNPFVGSFDGQGFTISNLVVKNNYNSLSAPPNNTENFGGAEIIGFFGVIGSPPDYGYTYTSEPTISNFVLENITVETQTDKALIGMIAGYVNGLVDKVGVVGSTVTIKNSSPLDTDNITDNMSDYGVIGFCTENFKNKIYSVDLYLYDPVTNSYQVIPEKSNGGEGQGWGGSVKMYDIFTWLNSVNDTAQNNANTNGNYYVSRVDVIGLGDDAKPVTNTSLSSIGSKPSLSINTSDQEHKFGTFVFGYTMNSQQGMDVNFVGGSQKVTEYKYTETNTQVQLYYIRNSNGQYYTFNGSTLGTTTAEGSAAKWYKTQQNGKDVFFTVYNNTVYYLNSSGSSVSVVSATAVDHDALPSFSGSNDTYVLIPAGQRIVAGNTSNYLTVSGTSVANTNDVNNAVSWTIEQVSGGVTIYTIIGGTRYYLSHQSNWFNVSLNLTTTTTSSDITWQYTTSENNHTFSFSTTGWNSATYHLRYNNGWTLINTNNNNNTGTAPTLVDVPEVTFSVTQADTAKNIEFTKKEYLDESANNRYYDANGNEVVTGVGISYFPLSSTVSGGSYNPSSGNTGYIVGAGWGVVDSGSTELKQDNEDSNIRISEYANRYQNTNRISNISTPYTMTFNNYTEGAFEEAPQLPTDESALTAAQKERIAELGFVKYADCYNDLSTSIVNGNCYGLHFMNTAVSAYTTTKIDAYLNGEWIPDYEVPLNCIDFNLYERGFINFLAGSYYTNNGGNDSFFSIYQIFRDGNEIKEIKEIYKIYGKVKKVDQIDQIDTSSDYVYTYVAYDTNGNKYEVDAEGNRVTNGVSGLTMIFDCDWITNPTAYISSNQFNNKAYYFEVPVNAGEYAIGSTKDKTGAYLIYLDLAANAQIIDRTRVDEKSVTEEKLTERPNGVSILEQADEYDINTINPDNSAFVSIGSGNAGGTLTQNGSTITDSGIGHTATHIGPNLQLVDGNGKPMTVPITKTITIEQSTYYDVNLVTGNRTVTVIKKITETADGETNVKYTKSVVVTDAEGNPAVDTSGNPMSKEEQTYNTPQQPDVADEYTAQFSDDLILQMAYVVTDPEAVMVNHSCSVTMDDDGNVTDQVYTITLNNTGDAELPVDVILTNYGASRDIEYIVVAGGKENALANNTDKQSVTVPAQQNAP